jgi:25S rRNA (uracil2634-N3)-methyltransferase
LTPEHHISGMGKGKGKGLKAALQSQQNRLKAKEKLSHAKQVAEDKLRRRGKPVAQSSSRNIPGPSCLSDGVLPGKKPAVPLRNPIIPFKASDRILLIGEGNFSFSRALIDHPPRDLDALPPENITATAYDTEEECYNKYPESSSIVTFLRDRGVEVVFGVDGTRLGRHLALKGRYWDRIVWNFPHAGAPIFWASHISLRSICQSGKGFSDQDRNILSNQVLILEFLRSASKILQRGSIPSVTGPSRKKKQESDSDKEGDNMSLHSEPSDMDEQCLPSRGTVLITIRNVVPYTHWQVARPMTVYFFDNIISGIFLASLKIRHLQLVVYQQTQSTYCCGHFGSTGAYGKGMSIV